MWKNIIIIVVLILLIAGIVAATKSLKPPVTNDSNTEETEATEPTQTLVVKHQYKDGQHVFIGDIDLPTTCHTYNAVIQDSEYEGIKELRVDYSPSSEESCKEVITPVTFRVAYEGSEDLTFVSFVNGEEWRLNAFEVAPEIDIDQFEIFIKG
jgi:hypothetical protein